MCIRDSDKVKESLSPDALTTDIVLRKTVDFVKSKAVITEKNAEEAEKETKPKPKTAKTLSLIHILAELMTLKRGSLLSVLKLYQ